jgi:hypothetical protein
MQIPTDTYNSLNGAINNIDHYISKNPAITDDMLRNYVNNIINITI